MARAVAALSATVALAGVLVGLLLWPANVTMPPVPPPLEVVSDTSPPTIKAETTAISDAGDRFRLETHVVGRAVTDPQSGGFRHEWPGFQAAARFRGDTVTIRLDDDKNRFRITVDEGKGGTVNVSKIGAVDLRLSGFGSGEHEIRLEKLSQSSGPARFGGFFIASSADGLAPPAAPSKLIEFIGDSDTVGYGGLVRSRECTAEQVFAATDTSQSFGPRVAAHFGAAYRMIARSGVGLVRNDDGNNPDVSMRSFYPLGLPSEPGTQAIEEQPADVVVIGLGSNDFGTDLHAGEHWPDKDALRHDFQAEFIAFVRARQQQFPSARLILLAFGEYGNELIQSYQAAVDAERQHQTNPVLVVLPRLDRRGCHWHPSPQDHAFIAETLISAIAAEKPDWNK